LKIKELVEFFKMFDQEKEVKIKSCSGIEWGFITDKVNLEKMKEDKIITLWIK